MTPLRLMSRQTALAYLFLTLGVLSFLVGLTPVVIGLLSDPRSHGDPLYTLLFVGLGVAILGAWLLPSSGAPAAVTSMVAVFGPYIPRLPGRSRVNDPPPESHEP